MSVFHNDMLAGSGGQGGGASSYQIARSLRFNSADSAYLSRTPAQAGNRKTWTWAGWVKRSTLATYQRFFWGGGECSIRFENDDTLRFSNYTGSFTAFFKTTAVYRDVSAWYHIVLVADTTNATSSDRLRIYVNGVRITDFSSTTYPTQNLDLEINTASSHNIGAAGGSELFSGYLADVHFIDGQSLTPSSFGEFDSNGVWQPKAYSGTYGTNGFRLDFSDNSSATSTGIGKDASGNGNNWTPTNFSVTAGAGNDSLVDSPTNYGTDTGAGGEVRGNYATLNPLSQSGSNTVVNGNLDVTVAAGTANTIAGTIGITSGKWYWEVTPTSLTTAAGLIGIGDLSVPPANRNYQGSGWYYVSDGTKYNNNTGSAYGNSYAANDVIGIALDMDAGTLVFYKNGSSQGTAYSTGLSGKTLAPVLNNGTNSASQSYVCNFGQRPFAYAAPSGFKALCTQNLPTPTIPNGRTAMDVVTYTGNGTSQSITGLGFSPDLVWIKSRSAATDNTLYDIVRGAQTRLESNTTDAEVATDAGLTTFNSDGLSLSTLAQVNTNSATYVAWAWDAGTSTVTNTAGTITSQVRANTSAGISIVSWTGNSTNGATVGHGLGVKPYLVIYKNRSSATNWPAISDILLGAQGYLYLNSTQALATAPEISAPNSVTLTLSSYSDVNGNGGSMIAYCFAPVSGFSAFGSYTGNGSADGPFVYTGFRPRWILIKNTSDGTSNWHVVDAARNTYNAAKSILYPNTAGQEFSDDTYGFIDVLSNGFKVRTPGTQPNGNGNVLIYAAFSENPFSIARAR